MSQVKAFAAGYDPADLRRLVALYSPDTTYYPTLARKHRECVDQDVVESCRNFLRSRKGEDLGPPFSVHSRRLVLAVAVDMGGDGAIGRLVRSEGDLADRLESVAGAPLDTITARWREAVVAAAGHSVVLSRNTAAFALLWVLALGLVGVRNARWR